MEPEKHRRKLLHVRDEQFPSKSNQATNWPHVNFSIINIFGRNSGRLNGGKIRSSYGATEFVFFPCVPCVSASHSPAFPVPCPKFDLAALLYNIYNAYILKQRSIGATSEMHLFPAKVGAKYAPGPTQPPRMPNFQQMSMN
jgi:hypothetical protein